MKTWSGTGIALPVIFSAACCAANNTHARAELFGVDNVKKQVKTAVYACVAKCWPKNLVWGMRATMLLLGLSCTGAAHAATRAWLERDQVAVNEQVAFSIETDQRSVAPDYAPLRSNFSISSHSTSRQMRMVNGSMSVHTLFEVILTPHQLGEHRLPALQVGVERTPPLQLTVVATPQSASASPAPTRATNNNELVFVQTKVDDSTPYVQQSVGVTVRLYFATQLATGKLDLETPAGASLQRVGSDTKSVQELNGRRYNVIERRFLLVPDRSGPLLLPGARFNGRTIGGFFDDYFATGSGELNVRSADTTLNVRAQPGGAPQPWLPVRNLQLRYGSTPQQSVAGEAAQITIEANVSGATQSQFSELPMLSVADAQVFAEPVQHEEHFSNGVAQLKLVRRYSIVPNRAGPLLIPGLKLKWWDVNAGVVRETALPALTLDVLPGNANYAATPAQSVIGDALPAVSDAAISPLSSSIVGSGRPWAWIALTLVFALLWLSTLLWALRRSRGGAIAVDQKPTQLPVSRSPNQAELRKALDAAGLDEVVGILCTMAGVGTVDQLISQLRLTNQREALLRLQRVRWAGQEAGDIVAVRQELRQVFWDGPVWLESVAKKPTVLEPLYPHDAH